MPRVIFVFPFLLDTHSVPLGLCHLAPLMISCIHTVLFFYHAFFEPRNGSALFVDDRRGRRERMKDRFMLFKDLDRGWLDTASIFKSKDFEMKDFAISHLLLSSRFERRKDDELSL